MRNPASPSHQTVRLSAGHHGSPSQGVCVMELASMLAGERFSDHPRTACPVIAAFLRAYNDCVDDPRRQDLLPYAAEVVGTRADRDVTLARAELCRRFVGRFEDAGGSRIRRRLTRRDRPNRLGSTAGRTAASNREPWAHSTALALVETLIRCDAGRLSVEARHGDGRRPTPAWS